MRIISTIHHDHNTKIDFLLIAYHNIVGHDTVHSNTTTAKPATLPLMAHDHGRRRRITLHSMRRWIKSTISDLGYGDFSEFMIGHSSSTYYRRTVDEKATYFERLNLI